MKSGIRLKMLSAFGVVMAVSIAGGAIGIIQAGRIAQAGSHMYEESLQPIVYLGQVYRLFLVNQILSRDMIHITAGAEKNRIRDEILKNRQENDAWMAKYKALVQEGEDKRLFDAYQKAAEDHRAIFDTMIALSFEGKNEELFIATEKKADPLYQARLSALQAMTVYKQDEADRINRSNQTMADSARLFIFGLLLIGLGASVLIALVFSRSISISMRLVTRMSEDIAAGDLSMRGEHVARLIRRAVGYQLNIKL